MYSEVSPYRALREAVVDPPRVMPVIDSQWLFFPAFALVILACFFYYITSISLASRLLTIVANQIEQALMLLRWIKTFFTF